MEGFLGGAATDASLRIRRIRFGQVPSSRAIWRMESFSISRRCRTFASRDALSMEPAEYLPRPTHGYLRFYLTPPASLPRLPRRLVPLGLHAGTAFLSRLAAICTVGADALILLGFGAVSAFLSHPLFCAATAFGTPDAPRARVSHTKRKSPGSTPGCAPSKPAPAFFCVSSGIPLLHSFSAFFPLSDPAQKTGRMKHTSSLGTI